MLIHTQIQFPVPALRTVVFSDNGEAKLVYVEILCGFVVGYDDCDVVYFDRFIFDRFIFGCSFLVCLIFVINYIAVFKILPCVL